jgi:hypothetical protein
MVFAIMGTATFHEADPDWPRCVVEVVRAIAVVGKAMKAENRCPALAN